jgi:tetraacyldisaccharide 4'-kinase
VTPSTPPPPRSPWQLLYGGAHRLRRRWYRDRAGRLPRPVVSVGNLHWGGGGKTPLVAALACHLRDHGLEVCVLSRGYRRGRQSGGGGSRVVSTGRGPLLGPEEAGDEAVLLAAELPGVAVVVGADRWRAGQLALERLAPPPAIFVLDDGFSHLALARDVDLLAFPAGDPFGGGRLLPGGRLREPLAAAARASAVVLTGAPGFEAEKAGTPAGEAETAGAPAPSPAAGPGSGAELAAALRSYGFRGPGFSSVTRMGTPVASGGEPLAPGTPVLAVAAIARPEGFFASLRGLHFPVMAELALPDHHPYPAATLARIEVAARRSGAACVLVTAKDRVKLEGRLRLPLAVLPVEAVPEPSFWSWLDAALELGPPPAAGASGQ